MMNVARFAHVQLLGKPLHALDEPALPLLVEALQQADTQAVFGRNPFEKFMVVDLPAQTPADLLRHTRTRCSRLASHGNGKSGQRRGGGFSAPRLPMVLSAATPPTTACSRGL